jgi:squalene-hopene/tetraprenyl-beta-curcumene cyclase
MKVDVSISELSVTRARTPREKRDRRAHFYRGLCYGIDWTLRALERNDIRPYRERALKAAARWVEERLDFSDGLAAIFPAFVNAILAFKCLGYADDHPSVRSQMDALERHFIEDEETLRIQPCMSPVWDTAQAMNALLLGGLDPRHPALERAARWLVDHEARSEGDWRAGLADPEVEPSGWYFEYANEFYPDCDDTAEVLSVLARVDVKDPILRERVAQARARGLRWLLAMQNDDGGWGAFDRNCNSVFLTHVPFADHNAMIDPSWEDITGRIIEMLAGEGLDRSHPAVAKAIEFLLAKQEPDGTWFGRWGCNYLYGTWLALSGLEQIGVDLSAERYQRAARWIRAHQREDGGWGESLGSYDEPASKGKGESTAAQTAWALMSLFATGDFESASVRRGIEFLLAGQEHGTWKDGPWTGTGFPRVFYLHYHYYDDYFPPISLGAYRRYLDQVGAEPLREAI